MAMPSGWKAVGRGTVSGKASAKAGSANTSSKMTLRDNTSNRFIRTPFAVPRAGTSGSLIVIGTARLPSPTMIIAFTSRTLETSSSFSTIIILDIVNPSCYLKYLVKYY
jgi:hypothetical protein